jgi:bifunctional UDP-N-acetylglucosamine pyrophosphorylase/glucosamine-1-phosphate N-acetyltransferase
MPTDFSVVILAAGLGTRMKSQRAKVLHRAGGKPLIELVVNNALEIVPADRIFVVVGHQADQVREALSRSGVRFIDQNQQLGTGHAVLVGREALSRFEHLLVLYGDCPLIQVETLAALMRQHEETAAGATILTTNLANPTGYGRILRNPAGGVRAIVEEKPATIEQRAIQEINSGFYCFQTAPLFDQLARLRPDNPAGEYYLTDVIGGMVEDGLKIGALHAADSSRVLGINTRADLAEVDTILRSQEARRLMLDGATIRRPETVTVDAGVSVGPDTEIEPFVQLLGRVSIGSGCLIGAHSIIRDSVLADEVVVEPFSIISDSEVSARARVGPYARLRMSSRVHEEARVGNFVELKKTDLGARSKAQHLAYLGDSSIGSDVNIGAGTITCNYDGVAKHATVVDDGAFVGSNSTLVAPVKIGQGAYLAAGSVITEEVPPQSLAIARGRQTNKPGWVQKRKQKKSLV